MKSFNFAAAAAVCLALSQQSGAAPVMMTFEGVGNRAPIGTFYEALYGVSFAPSALGLISTDAGGSGDFDNEPSPDTAMYYRGTDNGTMMNRADGFVDALSFFYTSAVPGTVAVYAGLNGTGGLLGSVSLVNQAATGCANNPAAFCNWSAVDIAFSGMARSAVFSSQAALSAFDNVSFNAANVVVNPIPAPTTIPLVLAALGALVVASRRRRG